MNGFTHIQTRIHTHILTHKNVFKKNWSTYSYIIGCKISAKILDAIKDLLTKYLIMK